MAVERINFLKVPIDILPETEIEKTIQYLVDKDDSGPKHIVFLNIWDLLKARRKSEFRTMVLSAALVIPTSKSIIKGANFLKKTRPYRYQPFHLIVNILTVLEKYYKNLYLLGARQQSLLRAEHNVKVTFPNLSVIGRYPGFFHKNMENNILTVISKSNPSLVLLGDGIPSGQRWINKNRNRLPSSIFIWDKNVIDIFSESKRRVSEKLFDKGLEYLPEIAKNPFRLLKIFPFLWYKILLLFYRLFRNKNN